MEVGGISRAFQGQSFAIAITTGDKQGPIVGDKGSPTSVSGGPGQKAPCSHLSVPSLSFHTRTSVQLRKLLSKTMSNALNEENTPDLKVDETPISPIERRNSLEKHLQQRPDVQDLKNRNILLSSNAAP